MQIITEFSKLPLPFPFGLVENENIEQENPRAYKWTKEEYYQLSELGFLKGKRTELIDGEIIEMPAMKSPHATALSLTDEALRQISFGDFSIRSQLPIDFGADELVPDIAVVAGKTRDYRELHPKTAVLIVEISDTTLRYDRNRKLKLYALHNVPEYWIVNVNNRCLEVYRRPVENGYKEVIVFNENESVSLLIKPDSQIAVSDLLP